MRPQHYFLLAPLAVCMLLVLSACGGPTPIGGGVTETVTSASPATVAPSTKPPKSTGSPTADVSPSPAATATEVIPTPGGTPPATVTPTPPATDTPVPDETPTPTPTSTAEITAPVIEGLKFQNDGGTYTAVKNNPFGVKKGEPTYNIKAGENVGKLTSFQLRKDGEEGNGFQTVQAVAFRADVVQYYSRFANP